MKSYNELIKLKTYEERLDYLRLHGGVGIETFGWDRYLNQVFYKSPEWIDIRNRVIIRDSACDLGISDLPIFGKVLVHHINPISKAQIILRDPSIFDMNNLICVSNDTHNAIHYDGYVASREPVVRCENDTCPWK